MKINTSYGAGTIAVQQHIPKTGDTSAFAEHLTRAVKSERDVLTATYRTSMGQFAREYGAWKETRQDKLAVPSKNGATEENIAYLNERYSGTLSTFEKMEALEAMRDMGMISQYQYMDALGTAQYLHVENLNTHQVLTVSPLNSSSLPANWGKGAFHMPAGWNPEDMPIQKVDSLKDLFEMLDIDKTEDE